MAMWVAMGFVQLTARMEATCLLVGEMVYAYYFVLMWERTSSRLLALVLLLPPSLVVPWRAPSGVERTLYSFVFLWFIGTKLLLLAWNRGLATDPVALSSFPRFFSAMVFSLHLKCEDQSTASAATASSLGSVFKACSDRHSTVNGFICKKFVAGDPCEDVEGISERKPSNELYSDAGVDRGEEISLTSVWGSSVGMLLTSQNWQIVVLRCAFYFVACASIVRVLLAWKPQIPEPVLAVLYAYFIYFICLFSFEGIAGIPAMICGIQLRPPFNLPYLATSVGNFWGRRWNLLVNNMLRASVYEPILQWERRQRKKRKIDDAGSSRPSKGARAVGTFASFLVSGLMHELIFFYLIRTRPTWEMTGFFVVNGIGAIVEMLVKKSKFWGQGFSVPTLVKMAYTTGFLYATGTRLFFPPLDRPGMIDACVADLGRFLDWIEQTVGLSQPRNKDYSVLYASLNLDSLLVKRFLRA